MEFRLRSHSAVVQETVAHELEEHHSNWTYSKSMVVLDMTWNMAFIVVWAVMLAYTVKDNPNMPIHWWIYNYVLQCLIQVALLWLE